MKSVTIGIAALVFAVGGALAAQGNGGDKGKSAGHGRPAPTQAGPAVKGKPGSMAAAMESRGNADAPSNARPSPPPSRNRETPPSANREKGKPADAGPARNGNALARADAKGGPSSGVRVLDDGRRHFSRPGARPAFNFASLRRGLIPGCPPGLAKKANGCTPPGLARERIRPPDWWGLRSLGSGTYYYRDGYLVRLNGGAVSGYVPLFGGALAVGNPWPADYAPMPVPAYYVDYYDLGTPDRYRYADDVLYRVDPKTSAITSIAALLTGDDFAIGAPVPEGYDVYNVPYPYRRQYADGPDAWYRYSDGYVYQIDPATRLVTAAIELIAS